MVRLNTLSPGSRCRIDSLETRGPMRRRLRELGLVEGTAVTCLGRSPLGDPAAYGILGAVIALRDRDAADVLVERTMP